MKAKIKKITIKEAMWNFFVSFSLTNHPTLLKQWKTWPNISVLLSRHRGGWKTCKSNENSFWSSLLMVWLLVSGSWHEGTEGKTKLFHCHTSNLVPSCLRKLISSSFDPHVCWHVSIHPAESCWSIIAQHADKLQRPPVLQILRELFFRSCFSCVGQTEVSD